MSSELPMSKSMKKLTVDNTTTRRNKSKHVTINRRQNTSQQIDDKNKDKLISLWKNPLYRKIKPRSRKENNETR